MTAPSRSSSPDYQKLDRSLKEETKRLNMMLPGEPIIHIDKGIDPPQNYRFMKELDVMLVTPLDDGMNLVAFEYILAQKQKSPDNRGILVLGMSGALRVLRENNFGEEDGIVYVNPMKPKEAATKIFRAWDKKRKLSERVINYVVKERRVDDWAEKNIEAITNCKRV